MMLHNIEAYEQGRSALNQSAGPAISWQASYQIIALWHPDELYALHQIQHIPAEGEIMMSIILS